VFALASCAPATRSSGAVLTVAAQPTATRSSGAVPAATAQPAAASISTEELEGQYGARVYRVAVTAVGGLVDLRIKILDAAKAKQLFQGQVPSLMVEGSGVTLMPPQDSVSQVEQLQDGGLVFVLYPNVNGAVKAGDEVTVVFTDGRLGPLATQ
jgi:hypothetical protein